MVVKKESKPPIAESRQDFLRVFLDLSYIPLSILIRPWPTQLCYVQNDSLHSLIIGRILSHFMNLGAVAVTRCRTSSRKNLEQE